MAKSTHWEDRPLKELQTEAYDYGVQGRRFTNKDNLIHAMRVAYWREQAKGGSDGRTR